MRSPYRVPGEIPADPAKRAAQEERDRRDLAAERALILPRDATPNIVESVRSLLRYVSGAEAVACFFLSQPFDAVRITLRGHERPGGAVTVVVEIYDTEMLSAHSTDGFLRLVVEKLQEAVDLLRSAGFRCFRIGRGPRRLTDWSRDRAEELRARWRRRGTRVPPGKRG